MEHIMLFRKSTHDYVYRIFKGNIHYGDLPYPLSKDKIKRYTKRLDSMGVKYREMGDIIELL